MGVADALIGGWVVGLSTADAVAHVRLVGFPKRADQLAAAGYQTVARRAQRTGTASCALAGVK